MNKIDIVINFVSKICSFTSIDKSTELIESGILSSLSLFELIEEIETEFDIRIGEALIISENFVTVEKIVDTVLKEVD